MKSFKLARLLIELMTDLRRNKLNIDVLMLCETY